MENQEKGEVVQFSFDEKTQLIFTEDDGEDFELYCNPCVENISPHDVTFEAFFEPISEDSAPKVVSVNPGEAPKTITFTLLNKDRSEIGKHIITISPSSYVVNHQYTFNDINNCIFW